MNHPQTLKRELGVVQVTLAGVGIILGAGIYTLMGIAAGTSGNATWLAFLLSAFIALFTGLSYAELSTIFRGDAGEFDYVKEAINKPFATFIGFSMIASGFISAATVALGFAGYFIQFVPLPYLTAAVLLIVFMTLINFIGIKEASWFNSISTVIEFGGLVIIILLALTRYGSVNYFEMPQGFHGVLSSTALVFFAYMGFESIVKLTEEAKDPQKTIPKALIYSLIITSILYVLVAIAAVSIIPWQELAQSKAPLATVAAAVLGQKAFLLLTIIALFSTANTVLITLVTTSRLMYGMAKENSLPRILAAVHERTRTPYVAIGLLMLLTILFAFIGDIAFVGNLTNLFLFITFASVNLALIVFRYHSRKKTIKRGFRCPINIRGFPVLSFFGLASSLVMIIFVVQNLMG